MRAALSKRVLREVDGLLGAWPDRPSRFWSLCTRITGWDALLSCASQHGVLEALRPGLLDERAPLTEAQRSWIKRTRAIEQWMQEPILKTLAEALAALESAQVKAVALKGPVLSERLQGEPSARRFTDLDFLVAPEDLERGTQALQSLGYRHDRSPSQAFFRAHHHHIHLHAADRPVLELHFLLSSGFGVSIPAAPFLGRSIPFTGKHGKTWVLAPEDEFLYLAQHAAGHHFARAAWLYDLKMLLFHHPNLDGRRMETRAAELGVARPLQFAMHVLRGRLGVQGLATTGVIRPWAADRMVALMEVLPFEGVAHKLVGLAYETLLADRWSMVSRLFRRRLALRAAQAAW
jgi:hypothetical protein